MSFILDEEPTRKTREQCLTELPDELRQSMMAVLASRDLLRWIVDSIETVGVAGEHLLTLTLYLTGTSRLLEHPLAVIVQGPSSSGKSYVLEKVAGLFPEEAVLMATDMTANALYYAPEDEFEHRFVVAGERTRRRNDETADGTKALREMISSGRLTKLVTISDPAGPRAVKMSRKGPIAYAESTTAPEVFPEDANRCLLLQPDERPEQTRRILSAYGRQVAGQISVEQREQLKAEFHALHRLLEPLPVIVPFGDRLAYLFPDEPLEVRRAFGHLTSMIQASALLHQYRRVRDENGRIVAQPEDYWLAKVLLSEVLARSLAGEAAGGLKRFAKQLQRFTGEHTAKGLAQAMKVSDRTVREHLNSLAEQGAIEQASPGRGPIPAKWNIPAEVCVPEQDYALLPAVGVVCNVDEESLELPEMPVDWLSANSSEVPF